MNSPESASGELVLTGCGSLIVRADTSYTSRILVQNLAISDEIDEPIREPCYLWSRDVARCLDSATTIVAQTPYIRLFEGLPPTVDRRLFTGHENER